MTALAEWRCGGSLSDEAPMDNETSKFVRASILEELKAKGRLVVHGRHRPVLLAKIGAQIAADTEEPLASKARAVPRRRSNQRDTYM